MDLTGVIIDNKKWNISMGVLAQIEVEENITVVNQLKNIRGQGLSVC